jgi:hypothetical protein
MPAPTNTCVSTAKPLPETVFSNDWVRCLADLRHWRDYVPANDPARNSQAAAYQHNQAKARDKSLCDRSADQA